MKVREQKKTAITALFAVVMLFIVFAAEAKRPPTIADTIIDKMFQNREFFRDNIDEYNALVYIKGGIDIEKRNLLYRFAPDFLYMEREAFGEMEVDMRYKAPQFFTQRIKTVSNPRTARYDVEDRLMQYLQVSIYNPRLINSQVRLPDAQFGHRYYRFEYLETIDTLGYTLHAIGVKPKIESQCLISGIYYIVDGIWMVFKIDITGRQQFSQFRIVSTYYGKENNFLVPSKTEVFFTTKLLGNHTNHHYTAFFNYNVIKRKKPEWQTKKSYNLSEFYASQHSNFQVIADEEYWEAIRPEPLFPTLNAEPAKTVESSDPQPVEEISSNPTPTAKPASKKRRWYEQNFAIKGIFEPKRFDFQGAQLRYSGLLNPSQLSYNKVDGWRYWQQIRYFKQFRNGHEFQFSPSIGLLFQRNFAYFRLPLRWFFQPRKFGEINFNMENHNLTYSNQAIAEELAKDSMTISDIVDHFSRVSINLSGKYEVMNGFTVKAGIVSHNYIPVQKNGGRRIDRADDDVENIIYNGYRTTMPTLGITLSPYMYYRIEGKRKMYVSSTYPTLSIDYIWGAKFFNSNSDFSKLEIDLQQKFNLWLQSSFQYYLGYGKYLNTKSMYFTNFSRFQRSHYPEAWGDPIGGVFHLLDGFWYQASTEYFQAHFMFDYPTTIFRLLGGVTKDIVKERMYLSQLSTPAMKNYTEFGYGIGNFVGKAAIFVAFKDFKYDGIGFSYYCDLW